MRYISTSLVVLVLCSILPVGCADDDVARPLQTPPPLEGPDRLPAPDFVSNDAQALLAESAVGQQLLVADGFITSVHRTLGPFQAGTWFKTGNCWTKSANDQGCVFSFDVCSDEGDLLWREVMDGFCDGLDFVEWTALSATTSETASQGSMLVFSTNSTELSSAFEWDQSDDRSSGAWNFYTGALEPDSLTAAHTWSRGDAALETDWEMPGQSRWELSMELDGRTGTFRAYAHEENDWFLFDEVMWNRDGTGSRTVIDGDTTTVTW